MPPPSGRGLPVKIFIVEMTQKRRTKTAWLSYLGIQALWLVCVILAPVAFGSYPSKYWAMPFCLITVAGGLHLVLFRREYDEILRNAVRLLRRSASSPSPGNRRRHREIPDTSCRSASPTPSSA